MSVFNISGATDWDVTDVGERLCQTFKKSTKKKRKKTVKKTIKNVVSTVKQSAVINKQTQLVNTVKNKLKKNRAEDQIHLTNSINEPHESTTKKTLKRKRSTELINEITSKRRKRELKPQNGKNGETKRKLEKLKEFVQKNSNKKPEDVPLRERMMTKLKAARFRFLNEQIYSTTGKQSGQLFKSDPEAFKAYHDGYKLQVKKWPMNPVDKIIKSINKMNKSIVVADMGCGEAKLSQSVPQQVHSFDLVAANDRVTPCDMAHVPLPDQSVDVVVFCLSLMGTNLKEYLLEAKRILKTGGMLKIAEVESRFDDVNDFIKKTAQYGFKKTWMDLSYNLFYFIDLKKTETVKNNKKLPEISLQPCLYKKR